MAQFSGDLSALEFDEPFQAVNHVLHSVLGYNKSIDEISALIRRGELGIEALIRWFTKCMSSWGVTGDFLEPRLERVRDAMLALYVLIYVHRSLC